MRADAGRCLLVVDPNPTTPTQSAWWLAAQAAREDVPRPVFQLLAGHGRVWCRRSDAMRALDDAERWADGAVKSAQEKAATIVADIALLPERSIEAVRGQFRTATVTNIKKEA